MSLLDIAIGELQHTHDTAKVYDTGEEQLSEVMRSFCNDLHEDVAALEKLKTSWGARAMEVSQLVADAKRVKRDLEKKASRLETAARLAARQQPTPAEQPSAIPAAQPAHSFGGIKLPPIRLPVFDGEMNDDYRGFMQAFEEVISTQPNLTPVRKWLLLKSQLARRALALVEDLPMAPETYRTATLTLEKAYGSTKRAVMKLYRKLQDMPTAIMETESLRITNAKIEGILLSLEGLDKHPNDDDFLRATILGKYPVEIMHILKVNDDTEMGQFRKDIGDYIQLRGFSIHRPTQPTIREQPTREQSTSNGKGHAEGSKKQRHLQGSTSNTGGTSGKDAPPPQVKINSDISAKKVRTRLHGCAFCQGEHWSDQCDKYASAVDRQKQVADRCQKCFRSAHAGTECANWKGCCYCKEMTHNRAICPKQFPSNGKTLLATSNANASKPEKFITAIFNVSNVKRTNRSSPRTVLDTAGGRSLITSRLANKLELSAANSQRVRLTSVAEAVLSDSAPVRKLVVFTTKGEPIDIEVCVVPEIVRNVVSTDVNELKKRYPKYAHLEMPPEGNGEEVDLLLGYAAMVKIVTLQTSIRVNSELQLMSTRMGWVPFGGLPDEPAQATESATINVIKEADPIRLMCDLELVGMADMLKSVNEEETVALEKFYNTIERVGNHYQIQWPYRYDPPDLRDNFGLAVGRLSSLYKSLSATPDMLAAYDKIIREQIEEDIIETVNARSRNAATRVHYLPHRGIIRFGKSTPIRMVFDASAHGKHSRSLNENILKGGNWVTDLPGVLIRFRKHGIAITSDIAKAFHQILIAPKDRDVVRFIWLRDIHKPPTPENLIVYRFKRMAFGIIASPFLLTSTIKYHLRQFPNPYAAQIESDLYADNLVTSLPRHENSEQFYTIVKNCFAEMGMNLTQWATDSAELRACFQENDRVTQIEQSALGINWNTHTKLLNINNPHLSTPLPSSITKRSILKETAKVFDPLGWVAPVVLMAKILIRKLWLQKFQWDSGLPTNLVEEWMRIRQEIEKVHEIELMRPYGFDGIENATKIELHAFCDASKDAYGTVVYLRIENGEKCWTGIVAAKSRLAPKTQLSIPRLELLAADAASKYVNYVQRMLQTENIQKYLWGDSRCVISWVTKRKVLPAIVEKAAKNIREAGLQAFSYVPTEQNPADVVSRGAPIDVLRQQKWWHGPEWLSQQHQWPDQTNTCNENEELADETIKQLQIEESKILLFYSSIDAKLNADPLDVANAPFHINIAYYKTIGDLIRRTAVCLKAAKKFLRGRGQLSTKSEFDYTQAYVRWIKWDQQRMYEPAKENRSNVSYLRNLKVCTDEDGLIRCVTRTEWAKVSKETAEPILLAKKTYLTRLIVLAAHEARKHAGTSQTLAEVRERYWLLEGRRQVYNIIHKYCFDCRRDEDKQFKPPEMAPLPPFRINRTERPFENVGLDAFGPYKFPDKEDPTKKKKYWVIIFTCLVVRAIHLEIVDDMTAEEFLRAFKKFTSRRGVPKLLVSDNAPQFHQVDKTFTKFWKNVSEAKENVKYFAEHQIQWKFVPPHAPWMGGSYERMIQTTKKSFDKSYGRIYAKKKLSFRDFELAIAEIEGVVNSRPITYIDRDADTEIITPNHFLCVRYPSVPIDFEKVEEPNKLIDAWKKSEEYIDEFWKIWSEMYLGELRDRRDTMKHGRKAKTKPPQLGEVVLMVDPSHKRSSWRTGVIERLIHSVDHIPRTAQVRLPHGQRMLRPITQLASLGFMASVAENPPHLSKDQAELVYQTDGFVEL